MKNKSSTIKERILYLADKHEVSRKIFFQKIGMTHGNFTGKAKETPINSNAILRIVDNYPEVDINWLVRGHGEMYKPSNTESQLTSGERLFGYGRRGNDAEIPLISQSGLINLVRGEASIEEVQSLDTINIGLLKNDADFAIRQENNLMSPAITKGDVLIARVISIDALVMDRVYLVGCQNFPMVKRFLPDVDGEFILRSDSNHELDLKVSKKAITFLAEVTAVISIL